MILVFYENNGTAQLNLVDHRERGFFSEIRFGIFKIYLDTDNKFYITLTLPNIFNKLG